MLCENSCFPPAAPNRCELSSSTEAWSDQMHSPEHSLSCTGPECTHRPLQGRESPRNTTHFCVLGTCQMSQIDSGGGNDHHHQVKKALQCWLSSWHSICSAIFITSLQLCMLLTSKGRGWNCYARACSSLANSIKYSRKRSSLIEPKILWLSWLNQLLFLQMTIPPFLSLLFRSLFPATPSFFFLFKV